MVSNVDTLLASASFNEDGLLPAVAQDATSGAQRRGHPSDRSYVASRVAAGWSKILGKIDEEARELAQALPAGDPAHTAHEAADLLFHLLVGLEAAQVPVDDVFAQLRGRFGTSGLTEKANRPKPEG